MKRASILLCMLTLLVGFNSIGAKPLPKVGEALRLKFEKGGVYYLEMKTVTGQKMKVMQQDVEQDQEQNVVIQVAPESRLADGDWLVGVSVVGMKMKIKIGGNDIVFDSTDKPAGSPLTNYFDALVKAKFKATLAVNGELKRLEGREELIKGLGNSPIGQEGLMKSLLSESALKKMFSPIGEYLPDRAERVGAHWNRVGETDLGPIGRYVYDRRYTYHDSIRQVHEIRATTTMKYQLPEKNDGTLPFTITDVKVTTSAGKGSYKFDADLGRLTESTHESQFKATMQIRIGNMDSEVEIDQKQTTKVRSLAKNPLQGK
jgi:hypothetical protein